MRIVGVLAELPGVELAAVVDQRADALSQSALPAAAARLRSSEELFGGGDVDLLCIATNGPSHAALALAAMDAGVRYLMIEKPMACSLVECDAIIAKARETGTRVVVDHVRCYAPAYQWLRSGSLRASGGNCGRSGCSAPASGWGAMRSIRSPPSPCWLARPSDA